MEKRRDPLEGFDWVFKPEPMSPPPDTSDDSFEQRFGPGPTMHDLDPLTEETIQQIEPSFLITALREHPRLRRTAIRTGLAVGAIITGVTAAFITHAPATGAEAMQDQTVTPRSSGPSHHAAAPQIPGKKAHSPAATGENTTMTPVSFAGSISASPTFVPRTITPTPTVSETVDATSRPPANSTSPVATPSNTYMPSNSPSETAVESPSPVDTESPSTSPTDIETTFGQTETPQASQSPSLGD